MMQQKGDDKTNQLKQRYTRLSVLYKRLNEELDEISKKEAALEKQISEAIDKEKMSIILNYIKKTKD